MLVASGGGGDHMDGELTPDGSPPRSRVATVLSPTTHDCFRPDGWMDILGTRRLFCSAAGGGCGQMEGLGSSFFCWHAINLLAFSDSAIM